MKLHLMDNVFLQTDYLPIVALIVSIGTAVGAGIGLFLQKKSIKLSAYDRLRADHNEILRLVVNNPILKKIYDEEEYDYTNVDQVQLKNEDHQIINYYALEFDLYERLVEAYAEQGLFGKTELDMWLDWLTSISKNWRFHYTIDKYGLVWDVRIMKAICDKFKINVVNEELKEKFKEVNDDYTLPKSDR